MEEAGGGGRCRRPVEEGGREGVCVCVWQGSYKPDSLTAPIDGRLARSSFRGKHLHVPSAQSATRSACGAPRGVSARCHVATAAAC